MGRFFLSAIHQRSIILDKPQAPQILAGAQAGHKHHEQPVTRVTTCCSYVPVLLVCARGGTKNKGSNPSGLTNYPTNIVAYFLKIPHLTHKRVTKKACN